MDAFLLLRQSRHFPLSSPSLFQSNSTLQADALLLLRKMSSWNFVVPGTKIPRNGRPIRQIIRVHGRRPAARDRRFCGPTCCDATGLLFYAN